MCDFFAATDSKSLLQRSKVITQFQKFGLKPEIMRGLEKMKFSVPSPVQEASIAPFLEKHDLLVQAPTGTGKTAAFGIPVVENTDPASRDIQTVVLCPTRELAVQIASVLKQLAAFTPGVRVLALYGGEPIYRQIVALKRRPQIIVATPGRLMDHIQRRTTRLNHVNCIVLDEADRMLDMGFREDIITILRGIPEQRQMVLFSATLSDEIKRISAVHQTNARQISIQQETLTVDRVEQYYSEIRGRAKTPALLKLLDENKFGQCLVFVATKSMADTLSQELSGAGHSAEALHGDLRQRQRDAVMRQYREKKINVLVATDVAARGIDVSGIDAVVNYDIPNDADSYVHRIGRTGRANRNGVAYTFVYPTERGKLRGIMMKTKASIAPIQLQAGEPFKAGAAFKPEPQRKNRSNSAKPDRFGYGKKKAWKRGRSFAGHRAENQ